MPSALISTGIQFSDNTVQRRAFPSGGILMWYGNIASVPDGWFLCNGANGTPDLRDRFVVGAGSAYSVGVTGGVNEVTLSVSELAQHSHPVTASTGPAGTHSHGGSTESVGNHTHPLVAATGSGPTQYTSGPARVGNATVSGAGGHGHTTPNTGAGGSHSHPITITSGAFGVGDAHENRPPYYALAYIMRA